MAGHRFTRGVTRGARRETSWFDIPLVVAGLDGNAVLAATLTVPEAAKRPFTIIRTHVQVMVHTDQQIASESWAAGFGLCVVSDQAAAIGVTAVPTPITDLDSDLWFMHQLQQGRFAFGTAASFANIGDNYDYDSKAMRKVNDAQDVAVVIEGNTVGNGMTYSIWGRLLIKEH